jgi:isoleucyl-tRNA synthetase
MFKINSTKPDFVDLENRVLEYWKNNKIVEKYLSKNSSGTQTFSFIDGPITANNPMGVHHAWGRTYKDLWQRYYTMKGKKQRYQNGFDAQGLWVEVEVEKELGFSSKKDIEKYGVAKFVQKCKDRVAHFSTIQTEQSKRLGYFMDWEHSYFTLSDQNNYMIWKFIKKCHEMGWLYKGNDSVPWCPRCETAISQHEMLTEDYKDVTHESIYFELPVNNRKDEYLLVWTTTPWTLPANIAVAVESSLTYALVEGNSGDKFWIAEEAVKRVFGTDFKKIINRVKGKKLIGLSYTTVFDHLSAVKKAADKSKLFHTVVATDPLLMPISIDEGTGLVHTAVSAGTEDYKLGQKLNLPMIPIISDNADYLDGLGDFSGKNAKKNPRIILDYMLNEDEKKGNNCVFKIEKYRHRYPACWRCKAELVWKVTDEWYIAMDKGSPSLRERMLAVAKKIQWYPSYGLDRELDWLSNMHDWLISKKNRYWGLSLPIWYCKKCDSFEVIGSKEELKKKAVEGWQTFEGHTPHKPYIDSVKVLCSKCKIKISRIEPVGNPWLDAGIVAYSTVASPNGGEPLYTADKKEWSKWVPADLISESFPGQFKNWFYSLIAMSTVMENIPPTKRIYGYATLLAESGKPMHKSWGNMIEFNEGADKIGVDVMRWMYVRQNPERNMLFGYKKADETRRKMHLVLWNVYLYYVTQKELYKTKSHSENVSPNILDTWILSELLETLKKVNGFMSDFDAFHASEALENFVVDLSTWYVRRSRKRTDKQNELKTLKVLFDVLLKMLSPYIPFITEVMYQNLGFPKNSIHLTDWPSETDLSSSTTENFDASLMKTIRFICEKGHTIRKTNNIKVRQPLSSITVQTPDIHKITSIKYKKQLEQLILDELNIKKIFWKNSAVDELIVELDITITPELKLEGQARDIIRTIQILRKNQGLSVTEKITVTLPDVPVGYKQFIKEQVNADAMLTGSEIKIQKI